MNTLVPLIVPPRLHIMMVLLRIAVAVKLTVDFFTPPGKSEGVMVNPLPVILQNRLTVAP